MGRDIESTDRRDASRSQAPTRPERTPEPSEPRLEPRTVQERGYRYDISPAQAETLRDIGRFRTIAARDLATYRYPDQPNQMRQDLQGLRAQGLLQKRTAWTGLNEKIDVLVLTKRGKAVLDHHYADRSGQQFY